MIRESRSMVVPLLVGALFLLLLLPFFSSETKVFMHFLAYTAMLLPFLQAVRLTKYQFLSLILVSTVVHLVSDACSELDACVAAYEEAQWEHIDQYFTNYAMTHLLFVVAFHLPAVEIAVPILVFISLLSVNLGFQSLFLILIALVCLVRGLLRLQDYYLPDLLGFAICFTTAGIFYFLDVEKRLFVFFYALSFAFATSVKKNANHFIAFQVVGGPYEKRVQHRADLY